MAGIELDVTDDEFYCISASVSECGFFEDNQNEVQELPYMFKPLKRICQARLDDNQALISDEEETDNRLESLTFGKCSILSLPHLNKTICV